MKININKAEAVEILTAYVKAMFPNMNIASTSKYDDFEFEVTKEKEEVKT